MTDGLVEFIRARVDEDEQVASSNAPELWPGEALRKLADYDEHLYAIQPHDFSPQRRAHVLRFDPARVLRSVEAKRLILDEHHAGRPVPQWKQPPTLACEGCGFGGPCDDPFTEDINRCSTGLGMEACWNLPNGT